VGTVPGCGYLLSNIIAACDWCALLILQAIPILNEALAALDTIKEADINYIKKLTNPPGAIKLVGSRV
jgi:dynein heavy chain